MYHGGVHFRGQAGSRVREMAALLLGNLGAKFSEMSFPKYKTRGAYHLTENFGIPNGR